MEYLRTDAMLMEILRDRKTITGFLDAIFGFLRRNTDFYHIKKTNQEPIGFPKGMREQILFGAMQRYDPECKLNNLATEDDGEDVPPAVEEVELEAEPIEDTEQLEIVEENEPQTPVVTEDIPVKSFFTTVDYKNGACFENYCWAQTLQDIELHVKLPENLQTSRLLSIDIKADKISIRSKAQPATVVLEGSLSNKCRHNDAVWTIAEGRLIINIDKTKEIWWERLFSHEPSIDIRKLDCERYIDELPEDSQAAIEKLRIEQIKQDSESARPISENENETLAKLRKAWDAEGSPFRGQPFDPSMVKFN